MGRIALLLVMLCFSAISAHAYAQAGGAETPTSYESGHGALEAFDAEGILSTPLWVKIWLGILVSTFAAGLAFVRRHPIARWAVGGFMLSATTSRVIFDGLGLPYLSGAIAIGHIVFWSPALFFLLWRRPFLNREEPGPFRVWSAAMTACIIFSFIFDVRDAAIYIAHISK